MRACLKTYVNVTTYVIRHAYFVRVQKIGLNILRSLIFRRFHFFLAKASPSFLTFIILPQTRRIKKKNMKKKRRKWGSVEYLPPWPNCACQDPSSPGLQTFYYQKKWVGMVGFFLRGVFLFFREIFSCVWLFRLRSMLCLNRLTVRGDFFIAVSSSNGFGGVFNRHLIIFNSWK